MIGKYKNTRTFEYKGKEFIVALHFSGRVYVGEEIESECYMSMMNFDPNGSEFNGFSGQTVEAAKAFWATGERHSEIVFDRIGNASVFRRVPSCSADPEGETISLVSTRIRQLEVAVLDDDRLVDTTMTTFMRQKVLQAAIDLDSSEQDEVWLEELNWTIH